MKYTTQQISTALDLVSRGATHEQAARKAKMKVYSVNYYLVLNRKKKTSRAAITKTTATLTNKYRAVIQETITNLQQLL